MTEVSATDAARRFSALLDAIEHGGETFTIVRRGRAIAHLEPVTGGRGADVKALLSGRPADPTWADELADLRGLVEIDERP